MIITNGQMRHLFITKDKPSPPKPKSNIPPVAIINAEVGGLPGESLQFDGSSSYDSDGKIVSYSWTFDDGTSAEGKTAYHSYINEGTYTVSLTVTDDQKATDSTSIKVTVVKPNYPPEISLDLDSSPGDLTVSLTVSISDEDEDSVSCLINWNDGSSSTLFEANNDQHTFSHTFAAYDSYTISVTANDGTVESSDSVL